jgi:hypothetical protein
VSSLFPCLVVSFPLKYLSIPLLVTKLPRSALESLVDRMANKLPTWKRNMMNHSGRLTFIKTTLVAMPIYTSISLGLPSWLIKNFEKIMRVFLWIGSDVVRGGKCLIAWASMQNPWRWAVLGCLVLCCLGAPSGCSGFGSATQTHRKYGRSCHATRTR